MPKEHDIVVYGATGYTGGLVVDYLARHANPSVRWAVAGRDESKLRDVARRAGRDVPVLVARADDASALRRMSDATNVVMSCAGPFARFGEPVVAACVDTRTDYVDITGEPDFVRDIILRHHERARSQGTRVVPCCGFDCVPTDLGVWFTMDALKPMAPVVAETFVHINWDVSGGTWQSMIEGMSRGRQAMSKLPLEAEAGRSVKLAKPRPRFEPDASGWVVPSPMIDPQIVLRSSSMLEAYGRDFRYGVYFRIGTLARAAAMGAAMGTMFGLAQIAPTRKLLSRLRPAGQGASEEDRERGFFRVTTVARSGGEKITTRVSGGDKYVETATMASEAALSLVEDRNRLPDRAGVLTPAVAFGGELVRRLDARGIRFELVRRTREAAS